VRIDEHEGVIRDIARWQARFRAADFLAHCLSADDLERAFQAGKVGVFFNLQNATYVGSDLDNLDVLHGLGVRMIQLTYNTRNLLGDGCTERTQAGLTHLGVAAVKRMNALGIVVDVAHSGVQTTLDAVEVSERPIAYSHTGCRALFDHPRSKTDEQLRALAARDGYVGIYAVPFFLTDRPNPSVDVMIDHIVHAAEIVGVERVGIGHQHDGEGAVRLQRVAHHGAVRLVVGVGPGHPDHPEAVGQLAVAVAQVQRGQQLAHGEIAGAAEDQEVARGDGGQMRQSRLQVNSRSGRGRRPADA
jgi:membrane dipeptidase